MYVPGTQEKDQTRVILAIRELAAGRSNATGTVTLTPSATTTVVSSYNCMANSVPFISPLTASAAAAAPYVSNVAKGQFTITHASAVDIDMLVGFVCLG